MSEELRQIEEWIKSQEGCPSDAHVILCNPNSETDKRLWFDVISDELARQSYEPDTNSSDPCWHSFELVTTHEIAALHACITALESALAAEREAHRWIPVTERLPEPEDETVVLVIILMDNGKTGVDMAYFRHGKFLTFAGTPVTHWQYLPQPPQEGEE